MPQTRVIGWEEANRNFLEVLEVEKLMMFFLLIFIVLVAAFSITNTLITSVYQKTREIGLLKALGCTDGSVMRIFIMQGFLVGLIGSISGTILGYLVIRFRQNILNFASMVSGQELFPKKFYFFDQLPAQIIFSDVAFIVICSIVLCTVGALLPALRAARLHPSEALRYE
jgi:lipoprotein-releasing system permease protein